MTLPLLDIKNILEGDAVSGIVMVHSYSKVQADSKYPLVGQFYREGVTRQFKIWDERLKGIFNNADLEGAIIWVSGTVDKYNGKLGIVVREINLGVEGIDRNMFFKSVDIDRVYNDFVNFVNGNLSQEGIITLKEVFDKLKLHAPFKHTFAGSVYHDAQIGGLLNHTMKMLRLAKVLVSNDERLAPWKDLLYLGIIFHDIGKIKELDFGVYTDISFVTHRTLGIEMLVQCKDIVVENFDENFFYHLLAIQQGHHGEYGDKPTTVWAYIVHLIDMLESQVTAFLDRCDGFDYVEKGNNKVMYINGLNLVF